MKNATERGQRWLAQAHHSLEVTRSLFEKSFFSDVCFMSEQTAQIALKAYLYLKGEREVRFHAVSKLAGAASAFDPDFRPLVEWGQVLDKYYLAPRYPDALPDPSVPFESFNRKEAETALQYAQEIVALVERKAAKIQG